MPDPKPKIGDGSEIRPYRNIIGRRALPHDPPSSIDTTKEVFFITICCKERRNNQLCDANASRVLFEATHFYEEQGEWFVHVTMLMPDHIHFLASFALDAKMKGVVGRWKRFTATHAKIVWQRDFFDHRLRGDESWRDKADYILANPVRAGLVNDWKDWFYVYFAEQR